MKQNDLISLIIKVSNKKTKDGKKSFKSYRTPMLLLVEGEEDKGKQQKDVTVKFVSELDTKSIVGWVKLKCYVRDIGFPRKYVITTDDNGKTKYPEVWIRGFESVTPIERDVENPFVTDEQETSETEIEEIEELEEETDEQ